MTAIAQQVNRQTTQGAVKQTLVAMIATAALLPATLFAQTPECRSAISAGNIAVQAVAASAVTGIEYGDMTRQGSWHMAQESDRMAVLADPSSHLHGLGSYRMARNLGATTCGSATAMQHAAVRGAAISLAIGAAKEVSDGWYNGFSTTDFAVDAIGAGYAVAQAYVPALQHITPTFSVAPAAFTGNGGMRGALTNYAHQTLWLSANVKDMLPTTAAKVWPAALRVSAGRRAFGGNKASEYVLGLDIDAERLPGSNPMWMRVKHVMHNVRLPGPAIVVGSNGARSMGLYW